MTANKYTHIRIEHHNSAPYCDDYDVYLYRKGHGRLHTFLSGISHERVQRILNAYPEMQLFDRGSFEVARYFNFGLAWHHIHDYYDFREIKHRNVINKPKVTDIARRPRKFTDG